MPSPARVLKAKILGLLGLAAAVVLLGVALPRVLPAFHQEPLALGLIYVVIALGLNIVNGQAGQFSIGHAAFAGIGGYTAGAITTAFGPRLFEWSDQTVSLSGCGPTLLLCAALLTGGLTAGLSGLLVGMPTLRLRGDYLAIATLGFGEIVRVVITNTPALGGALGMHGIPRVASFPVIATAVVLVILVCRNIATSVPGRCLVAVREDEIAAESLGISTTRAKVSAMTLSAGIAGLGGGLLAHHLGTYNPVDCSWIKSVEFVLMVVLGGSGSITGTTVAAVFLGMLPGEMLMLSQFPLLTKVTGNKMVLYSLLLIVLMLVRRQGIAGRWELSLDWLRGLGGKLAALLGGGARG